MLEIPVLASWIPLLRSKNRKRLQVFPPRGPRTKLPGPNSLGGLGLIRLLKRLPRYQGPGIMSVGGRQKGPQPFTLPDLRRRPGWSPYTGLQDPVVTRTARNNSDPTTTVAWCVTQLYKGTQKQKEKQRRVGIRLGFNLYHLGLLSNNIFAVSF